MRETGGSEELSVFSLKPLRFALGGVIVFMLDLFPHEYH